MEDKLDKSIGANEFVKEMQKLGYNIDLSDNQVNTNYSIMLSLAKQIEELKNK